MALRAILFISIILLFIEGGAKGNTDDFDLPKTSSYEAHRFGLDSTNQAQLQEFFHPTSPKNLPKSSKSISHAWLRPIEINPTYVNGALWHQTYDINVENGKAYVSMVEGMGIFDVSNPAIPRLIKLYYRGHMVWDIQVDDSMYSSAMAGAAAIRSRS